MAIENIPVGTVSRESSIYSQDSAILPLLPKTDPVAVHVESVASDTATSITLTGTQLIEVVAEDYGVYVRRTTAEDTDACTSSNFHHYVPAGSIRQYGIKDDATGLSLIGKDGTADITIVEY